MGKMNRKNFTKEFNEELNSFNRISSKLPIGNVTGLAANYANKQVAITWKDPADVTLIAQDGTIITLAEWAGTKIVRKLNTEPTTIDDGELIVDSTIRNQYSGTALIDTAVVEKSEYVYRAFPYTVEGIVTSSDSVSITAKMYSGPGPDTIIGGDETAGFFGEVPAADFITGDELTLLTGLNAGMSINRDTPWLKFSIDGKIIFSTKKPIRNVVTWSQLNAFDLITGARTIKIGNDTYKVRLWKGAEVNPSSTTDADRDAVGSEWNRLMLPIHAQAATGWEGNAFAGDNVPNWNIGYTDADLVTHHTHGEGAFTWCQETPVTHTDSRIIRGYYGVTNISWAATSFTNITYAWRPVLELVR